MSTNMKHQVTSAAMMMLALAVGPLALPTTAWGSLITVDSVATVDLNATYNLTTMGQLDWALPGKSEKAGGTVIATDGVNGHLSTGYGTYGDWENDPRFSYTNGEPGSNLPNTNWITNAYEYKGGSYSATINLPANVSGTITVWCETWSYDGLAVPGTFTATFADSTSATGLLSGDGARQMVTLSYSTAIAQSLTLTLADTGASGNAGFFALAVVPEPASALLLASGLMTLVSRTWRKRN
ncbi:MAG: hypothetical protein WC708_04120 [Lentisphaeria bacterium]